jgi:hypothetical protein
MPIKLFVHAKGRGIALDPAGGVAQCGADGTAFGAAGRADEDEEVEVATGESLQILLKALR